MPTFASSIRRYFRHDRCGASAIEFGLIVPFLMLATGAVTELGSYFVQLGTVEKGLRSAAMYAARSDLPLSTATLNKVEAIARTGEESGGSDLVKGWAEQSATLQVTVTDVTSGGATVPVIRLIATLPYSPIVPIIDELAVLRSLTISATQEQAHIGG